MSCSWVHLLVPGMMIDLPCEGMRVCDGGGGHYPTLSNWAYISSPAHVYFGKPVMLLKGRECNEMCDYLLLLNT